MQGRLKADEERLKIFPDPVREVRVALARSYASWRRTGPLRVRLLIVGMVLAASGLWGYSLVFALNARLPPPRLWLLTLVIIAVSGVLRIGLRVGGSTIGFDFSEAGFIGVLSLVDVRFAILLLPVSGLAFGLTERRPLTRRLHYGAMMVLAYGVGAVAAQFVLRLLGSAETLRGSLDGPRALALAAGGVTVSVFTALAVVFVLHLQSHRPVRQLLAESNTARVLVTVGNLAFALGTLALVDFGSTGAVLLPLALVFLLAIYRAYVRIREDRDAWRTVQAAAGDLALLDEPAFLAASADRARQLFGVPLAELVVPGDPAAEGPPPTLHYRSELVDGEIKGSCRPGDGVDPPGHVIRAELPGHDGVLGELRLAFSSADSLAERERMVLDTFRKTVGLGMDNARLHAQAVRSAAATAWAAQHDALTGLANRRLLHDSLARSIAAANPAHPSVAVVLINIDHFKQVNDTLGPPAGDRLLIELAERLVASTRQGDVVGRLVSDTFVVITSGLSNIGSASRIAHHLLGRLSEEIQIDGLRILLEARAGVACWPEDGTDPDTLLTRAEQAGRQSRELGQSVARYHVSRDQSSVAQLSLVAELRDALANHELSLFFQPQVDTTSGEVHVLEALARWEHPTRGMLTPDAFIPVVEQSGLVRAFTLEVIDQALAAAASWREEGHPRGVSVNLSARNLLDLELPGEITAALARHDLPPTTLTLEITETMMVMTDLDSVEQVLAGLTALGVGLSVDDFGTGYSSLSFLLRWKVAELKIDRSFVNQLLTSNEARMLIVATIELAHGLQARVVAEGVETQEEAAELIRIGCDRLQGYLYSKPVRASHLPRVLAELRPVGPALAPVIPLPFARGR
jgi:diguanylate cyclase (GGDEF)-like protein